ncbi:MAG TPA: MerR family transcriptional regulator [Mycobacteriales bacterium]|nr:MerR family transcriptional regulator [Mycobacteriales bacterium]
MSIGEVLAQLRGDFPDVTISKIRFLEAEGLIEPERTSSGYRKFSRDDVSRLRYVLAAQRDRYLPLRVIKTHLEALDRGLDPPEDATSGPQVPRGVGGASDGLPGPDAFVRDVSDVRLTRDELAKAAGLTLDQLSALEQYGMISLRSGGSYFDGDALLIAKTVAEMSRYGIEARHLRPFKSAADREIGLFEQVVTPLVRQRNPEARARSEEVVRELAALSIRLHSALVRAGLRPGLTR